MPQMTGHLLNLVAAGSRAMRVCIGIDWSETKHDICYLHENGEVLRTLQVQHTLTGFMELDKARRELGVTAQESVVGYGGREQPANPGRSCHGSPFS